MMDVHEIAALLQIQKDTREQPSLKAIHDAAMRKLNEHNNSHMELTKPDEVPPTAGPLTLGALQEDTPTNGRRI
jgi:hypothetical protein